MKKLKYCLPAALPLFGMAFALAEAGEGVRVTGSKLPSIIGGIAAIAIGLLITIVMVATKEGRAIAVTPTGLPIPVPLMPLIIGVVIGLTLFTTKPDDSYTLNGVRYSLGEKSAAAVGFAKGADVPEVLKLPAEVEGLPLESVRGFGGTAVREVVLPYSLRRLDDKAFKDCASLETVRFEGGEEPAEELRWQGLKIGDEAFSGCAALRDLSLPKSTSGVGSRAFMGCAALTHIELPGAYGGVGSRAFSGCGALKSATLSPDIQSIGTEAFAGCAALESVRLAFDEGKSSAERYPGDPGVERSDSTKLVIGDRAFENCAALRVMEFPRGNSIKSIGERAFAGCARMETEVPAAHLEKYCFEGCAALRSVATNKGLAIGNDRMTVPEGAFKGCTGLVIADLRGIEKIGAGAFENCAALRQVTATWTENIGERAFANCPALQVVGVTGLKKLAKDAFEGSDNAVIFDGNDEKTRKLAGDAGLKADGGWWFQCEYLPDGSLRLTGWPEGSGDRTGAFTVPGEWCGLPVSAVNLYEHRYNTEYSLGHEEIIVEEGVRTLEERCFENWEKTLRRIRLPGSVEAIERDAIPKLYDQTLTVYTDNPVAVKYAQSRGFAVAEP